MLWGVYPEVPKKGAKWWWATFIYMMEATLKEVKHFGRKLKIANICAICLKSKCCKNVKINVWQGFS